MSEQLLGHDEQEIEAVPSDERIIVKRDKHEADAPTPLAFVIDTPPEEYTHSVTEAKWSSTALGWLRTLHEALQNQNPKVGIPIAGLRSRLELNDAATLRLDHSLGLGFPYDGMILWTQTDPQHCQKSMHETVLTWLVNNVASLASSDEAQHHTARLKDLVRQQRAIETTSRVATPYAWGTTQIKTTKAISPSSYADLADFVARHLEEKTVFPELPGLRRIVSGNLNQNQAELMTLPIHVGRSRFSLVLRVRVLSYPGRSLPIIAIEFSRRTWTTGLKSTASAKNVSAYAFPEDSQRAFKFTLSKKKGEDGTWSYQPDDDFAPLARQYFHDTNITTERILKEGHRLEQCPLLVGLKHGVGERSESKSGVPDLDKIEGFEGIAPVLAEIGLVPWKGLRPIETDTRAAKGYQHWRRRDQEQAGEQKKYEDWLQEAQESIRSCYAGEHHIVIAVQPEVNIEADAQLAEERLHEILPGSVVITRIPISPNVHGPRNTLPGKDVTSAAERAAIRIEEWSTFIDTVKQYEQRSGRKIDGILVLARRWYSDQKHDDTVNKRAGRIALAKGLGTPVQYLRPRVELHEEALQRSHRGKPKTAEEIEQHVTKEFENHLMHAWLDLAYKSLGRVRPWSLIKQAQSIYTDSGIPHTYPDRVLALGVVRRNKRRFLNNERSFLPYAIELDVEHGICTASFAYEHPETRKITWTDQLAFPQALVTLASLGPIQLTSEKKKKDRKQQLADRTQAFFKNRLADFGRRSSRSLVIIDADTSRSVWPWLQDASLDANNVSLAGGYHAEAAWPQTGLVRVRTENSPKVLWNDAFSGTPEESDEEIRYRAPGWAQAELFKLTDTYQTDVYLSFGSIIRKLTKGKSCYREIPGMKQIGRSKKYRGATMERHTDAWTTPTGLEICVVRAGDDEPDQIAQLVEWLRQCYAHFGDWTTKPAPLYFERALKEYLADYELEEDEHSEEDEEG
jgi:hypothetical protein